MVAKLSEYLDGELDDELCSEVDDHLSDCAPCESLLDSLRRTIELVEELPALPLPDDVRRRVREAYVRFREDRG
jgi:anti-sigma factor RsiW